MIRIAECQEGRLLLGQMAVDRRIRAGRHDERDGRAQDGVQLRKVVGAGLAAERDRRNHVAGLHEGLAKRARHGGDQMVLADFDRGDDDVPAPGEGALVEDDAADATPETHKPFGGEALESLADDDEGGPGLPGHFTQRRQGVARAVEAEGDGAPEPVDDLRRDGQPSFLDNGEWELLFHGIIIIAYLRHPRREGYSGPHRRLF